MLAAKADTDASISGAASPETTALALLEDHLNAVLRHGEALRALERPAVIAAFDGPGVPAMMRRNRQIDALAGEAHALELALILRLMQARVTALAAKRHVSAAAGLLRLIATVADLVVDNRPQPQPAWASADAFFAGRGMSALSTADTEALGEGYLVAGRTPLSAVMDAAAAALDLLDSMQIGGMKRPVPAASA